MWLELRVWAGSSYVSVVNVMSMAIQLLIPKQTQIGRVLARLKKGLVGKPVPRLTVLLDALSRKGPVRFVQIGANDGILHDPLRPFVVKYAWRGLLVEPLPHIFERLKMNYTGCDGLTFENAAISSKASEQDFYYVANSTEPRNGLPSWHSGLGSLSRDVILKHSGEFPELARHVVMQRVRCMTFEELCDNHRLGELDLIAVDAEGHDFEILNQIDFRRHRPLVVLYEHHHMTTRQIASCRQLLAQHGYEWFEEMLDTICLRIGGPRAADRDLVRLWNTLRAIQRIPI